MQHLDEGMIHAWLDGELPLAEGAAVASHVAQCEQCAAAVAEARGFIAASSRILTALDTVPGGVLPAAQQSEPTAGARAPARFRISRAWMAAAAVLVLSTVTVIAIGPRRDVALRMAEARKKSTASPIAAPEEAPAPAASNQLYSKKPSTVIPSAPARAAAPAEDRPTLAGKIADKSSERELAERKDARAKLVDTSALSVIRAAPRREVTDAASGVPGAGSTMSNDALLSKAAPSPTPAKTSAPTVAQTPAPASQTDSLSRTPSAVVLQQLVITGEGATTGVEKLGVIIASDTTSPTLVSRETTTDRGDTLVTTLYDDHGVRIMLLDRSPKLTEYRRTRNAAVQFPFGKTASSSSSINAIAWSDSTGRYLTLRGATSLAELERIKTLLFGPTP